MKLKDAYATALVELGMPVNEAIIQVQTNQMRMPFPLEILNRELTPPEARQFIDCVKESILSMRDVILELGLDTAAESVEQAILEQSQRN